MRTKSLGCLPAYVIAVTLVNFTGAAVDAQERPSSAEAEPEVSRASTTAPRSPQEKPRLVRITDPVARRATVSALNTAVARFEDTGCRRILLDFADRDGTSLADRLQSLQIDF